MIPGHAKFLGIMRDVFDTCATFLFGLFFISTDPQQHLDVELPPSVIVLIKIAYIGIIFSSSLAIVYWVPKIKKTVKDDYKDSLWGYFSSVFKFKKRNRK